MKRQSEHRPTLTFRAAWFRWFTFTEYMRPDGSKGYSSLLTRSRPPDAGLRDDFAILSVY